MTEKKASGKKHPGEVKPKRTKEEIQKWVKIQREIDEKLKEIIYEDRNGFKPPKPWYEE